MYRATQTGKLCALAATTLILVGCLPAPSNENAGDSDATNYPLQVLSDRPDVPTTTGQFTETEPNDSVEQANILNDRGYIEVNGTIPAGANPIDMDVFRLNGGQAGTRFQASMIIRSGNDLVLGVLDDQQRLLAYADPTSTVNGPRQLDVVFREETAEIILVVAARSSSSSDRPYTVRYEMLPVEAIPAYQPQILVLNFSGADSVKIGRRTPVYVPPFSAETISSAYTGQTQNIINLIVQHVREDYAGLGVEVYASGDPGIPAGGITTVHFGTYDASLLGLADSIDPYNALTQQNAIVYTDTFRLFNVLRPNAEEIAQVLANTASHEAGHLLGLRHTQDVLDVMDITASARQMMVNQWFRTATIHSSVLPTGFQNAPALLEWALGGTFIGPSNGKIITRQRQAAMIDDPNDFHIPRSMLGTCGGDDHAHHDGHTEPASAAN